MSELSKLAGKSKKVRIGEIELEIKPLSVSDMDLMMNLSKEGPEQIESMKTLIKKVLNDAIPDATDEEIDNVAVEHIMTIMEAIMEVNNLDTKTGITPEQIEKIKEKQKKAGIVK